MSTTKDIILAQIADRIESLSSLASAVEALNPSDCDVLGEIGTKMLREERTTAKKPANGIRHIAGRAESEARKARLATYLKGRKGPFKATALQRVLRCPNGSIATYARDAGLVVLRGKRGYWTFADTAKATPTRRLAKVKAGRTKAYSGGGDYGTRKVSPESRAKILETISLLIKTDPKGRGYTSPKEIRKASGLSSPTVSLALKRLVQDGTLGHDRPSHSDARYWIAVPGSTA